MLGRAVAAVYKGGQDLGNPYNWHIAEYIERIRLKKLGFTSDFDNLDAEKSQIFQAIDIEIDALNERKRKREEQQRKLKQS